MIRTTTKRRNRKKRQKEVTRKREEEESSPESVQAGDQRIRSPKTRETIYEEEEYSTDDPQDLSECERKVSTVPLICLQADVIHWVGEISGIVEASNIEDTEIEVFRKAIRIVIANTIELAKRANSTIAMNRRLDTLEAEYKALRKDIEEIHVMNNNRKRLDKLEQELEMWKEMISFEETEVSDPQVLREVSGEGIVAVIDWPTVGKKAAGKKNEKRTEESQSKEITPGIGEKSSKKDPERSPEDREMNSKLAVPHCPKTSTITITIKNGTANSYAEALATARKNINLADVGIDKLQMKKTETGMIILEVPEDQKGAKAAALAARMTKLFDSNVRVVTLGTDQTAEVRLSKMDISATEVEIKESLAQGGGCKAEDIQVGKIRISKDGLGTVCVRCPVEAVQKLIQVGRVIIGWSKTKIEAIEQRPLQCFRCLEIGHVKKMCTSKENREHLCYRCGVSGHLAKECTAANPKCPLCEALGAPAAHRMGGSSCAHSKKETKAPTQGPVAKELTDGSAVKNGKKKGTPRGIRASKEFGVEEAIEALHLSN